MANVGGLVNVCEGPVAKVPSVGEKEQPGEPRNSSQLSLSDRHPLNYTLQEIWSRGTLWQLRPILLDVRWCYTSFHPHPIHK